jgi:hypothetical protein
MSGVRHLKELSARVATQGGMDRCASSAGRQSDGDDSRQHSPDKQVGLAGSTSHHVECVISQ